VRRLAFGPREHIANKKQASLVQGREDVKRCDLAITGDLAHYCNGAWALYPLDKVAREVIVDLRMLQAKRRHP
jgi:hypothetical protein